MLKLACYTKVRSFWGKVALGVRDAHFEWVLNFIDFEDWYSIAIKLEKVWDEAGVYQLGTSCLLSGWETEVRAQFREKFIPLASILSTDWGLDTSEVKMVSKSKYSLD